MDEGNGLVELKLKASPSLRDYAVDVLGVNPFALGTQKPRMEEFFKHAFWDRVICRVDRRAGLVRSVD